MAFKAKKIIFRKNFTRNTTLILQQLWPVVMEEGIEELKITNPYRPTVVDYINQGTCEIWENDFAVAFIARKFIEYCQKEPQQALLFLQSYQRKIKKMETIWQKGVLDSLPALKKFIALVKKNMVGDLFIVYVSEAKGIDPKVRELVLKLRASDHYFSASNEVFSNTLKKLFPQVKKYVDVIGLQDLDKMPRLSELKQRYQNYICVGYSYGCIQTLSDYARLHPEYTFVQEKLVVKDQIIKGRAANLGKVQGIAKLIFTTADLKKVKKSDILVSPMTTVNFMPAIKKAAGIITDEGGIACHAAIVARELKKPCLIATKTATQFFQDGDLVALEADKGWAKLIKRGSK